MKRGPNGLVKSLRGVVHGSIGDGQRNGQKL